MKIAEQKKKLFELGPVVITVAAQDLVKRNRIDVHKLLERHQSGDWGDLDKHDVNENNMSVKNGYRILSSYKVVQDEKIWIITESDRSSTTILLPSDY